MSLRKLMIDLPDPTTKAARDRREAAGLEVLREQTTARIAVGRVGTRPQTTDALLFAADHAVTQDAILRPVDPDLLEEMGLMQVQSMVGNRQEYLQRPDLGRRLSAESIQSLTNTLPARPDVQIFVGDGLSAAAVEHNLPTLLPALTLLLQEAGLTVGTPFFVHNARVGLLNAVNEIVDARVCVVLIGERPGLARAESMSVYLGFRPNPNSTDAHRNVISNIYAGGTTPRDAAAQTVQIIQAMLAQETSGVALDFSTEINKTEHGKPTNE